MTLKEKDFIEIEFTGRIKEGEEIFDSNIKNELQKLNPNAEAKPFIFSLGEDMFLKGVDEYLIGKNLGKYKIELIPEKAFGKRNSQLIQRMSIKIFHEQKINPVQGYSFNFDGRFGRIIAVSGGRVLVDFNNPLAGKEVIYEINVLRKIENIDEKIKALNDFFFRRDFEFEIENKKLKLIVNKGFEKFVELFKDKYQELVGLTLETKIKEEPASNLKNKGEKSK